MKHYPSNNFSENLATKPKFEAQDTHFSGKKYTLHYSIVQPGDQKYIYHRCDDTTHNPTFVHLVLGNIFETRSIKNEAIIIENDNAPQSIRINCCLDLKFDDCVTYGNTFDNNLLLDGIAQEQLAENNNETVVNNKCELDKDHANVDKLS